MLSPWLELPGAADRLASWSAASGLDLARLGTTASTEEITNTAIAEAKNPVMMAHAMKLAVEAGRVAYLAGRMPKKRYADPSSPLAGLI